LQRALFASCILGAVVCAAVAAGQGSPSILRIGDVRPGMKGHGLTVFRGTEPERFDVEVIDVLHNFRPDQGLILVRTSHPVLEGAKIVAGMSGSPVYLDGKLAGAYAYGWSFGREPVAGVTPIANMLAEMRRPVRPDSFPGARPLPELRPRAAKPPAAHGSHHRLAGLPPYKGTRPRHPLAPLREHAARLGSGPGPALTRAATPVMLGGFTDEAATLLADALEPFGLIALQAGGTGARARPADPPSYVDGGAIGVQLMRGDVSATAVGTITHVGRRRLVAFGHPMLNGGELGLPAASARVLHVLQSQNRSFKIAEALAPGGTMIHDRQSAIVVDRRLEAPVVPVTIRIHGVTGAPRTEWRVEVPSHRLLSPALTMAAVANAVTATVSDRAEVVFRGRSRVTIEGHGQVTVEDRGFSVGGAATGAVFGGLRMFDLMEVAYGNPFEESRVTAAELDLHLEFSRDVMEIVDAAVSSKEVDPGSTVPVHVVTRRFGQPEQLRIVPVRIPERAAGQEIKVKLQPGNAVDLEHPEPKDLDTLVRNVTDRHPATSLVVSMELPTRGLRFRGHVVRALPPSALDTLQLVNDSAHGRPFVTEERQVMDMGTVLTGSAVLELEVRERPRKR
jgi:hypothetical protein